MCLAPVQRKVLHHFGRLYQELILSKLSGVFHECGNLCQEVQSAIA